MKHILLLHQNAIRRGPILIHQHKTQVYNQEKSDLKVQKGNEHKLTVSTTPEAKVLILVSILCLVSLSSNANNVAAAAITDDLELIKLTSANKIRNNKSLIDIYSEPIQTKNGIFHSEVGYGRIDAHDLSALLKNR